MCLRAPSAAFHPQGADHVLGSGDRGSAVAAMGEAFARYAAGLNDVGGMLGLGGGGGTSIVTAGMRELAVGVPKIMVSTLAAGDVKAFVGTSDISMMYSVTDVAGLNRISRTVLGNAAHAIAGMASRPIAAADTKPAVRADHVRSDHGLRDARCRAVAGALSIASCFTPPAAAGNRWRSW
jgi:uncharacterized protein (UPF0261 family)